MKNRAYHSGIKQSPHKAMFGFEPRVGLSSSFLPSKVSVKINNENELWSVIDNIKQGQKGTSIEEDRTVSRPTEEDKIVSSPIEEDRTVSQPTEEDEIISPRLSDKNNSNIFVDRKRAAEVSQHQAKRMKHRSDRLHKQVTIGDCVIVPIPEVDRAKCDLRNIKGVDLEENDGLYRIGTKNGVINKQYSKSEFDVCQQKFLQKSNVPTTALCLRTLATQQSHAGGQGYFKCSCRTYCKTKICICRKNNIVAALFPTVTEALIRPSAGPAGAIMPGVTLEELRGTCNRIRDGAAPGPDGVPNRALNLTIVLRPDAFLRVYSACLSGGVFLSPWKRQRPVLIPKPGRPPDAPSSYRTLCTLDMVGKIL
ncbi:unnamed protein product [Trichogramma brassicae]|uniref:Reverse transcriptase domain-containing protein n=1 Tax=Trichogramma brassicae TaxID=86971 RepID=A0A6H5I463_9HYME|nr:unnamed protein product [Trichogramma brassicae]